MVHWPGRAKRRKQAPPGSPPGMLVVDPEAQRPVLRLIAYGPDGYEERELASSDELDAYRGRWPVLWLNVDGLGGLEVLEQLQRRFELHALALEDVLSLSQRPKLELYPDHYFVVCRLPAHGNGALWVEQLSLFVGSDFVLSFQERSGDPFDPVRKRIRDGRGRIRAAGAGYLCYALLDAVVDGYFPILEQVGELLEDLEDEVVERPTRSSIERIHRVRRELLLLRRALWPMRDAVGALYREPSELISEETRVYLRDCHDHCVRQIEMLESFRELASSLMDVYLSSQGNRMNEVMKVLTVIATIFIPLTFISGLYGMNFDSSASPWNMPELGWRYGYPAALGLMAVVALSLVLYFKVKGWLGEPEDDAEDEPPGRG